MAAAADLAASELPESGSFRYKIIIIGAGIAGLSAANYLVQNGETDFKILEARNRIGGRIISISEGDKVLDLGAAWIHGVLGNPVYELAVSNGLISITDSQEPHPIVATTEDGKRVPLSIVEEVFEAYFWFTKRCEEYFLLHLHTPPQIDSVGKHLELDIAAYLQQYSEEDAAVRRMVFDHLLSKETCITGCHSMDETSLGDFGSYEELPGGNILIPGGYEAVVKLIADTLPKASIRLQSEVSSIKWKIKLDAAASETSEQNSSKSPRPRVLIECKDGTKWESSHVIITIPLGVLKLCAKDLFDPKLPDYKLECIDNLYFGTVNKIYLVYDRPFLNAEISEVLTLWKRTEETDISKTWFRKIYSFSRFKDNVLLGWLSGKEAEYLETLSEEQVATACTDILRKFLNDPYIPKPTKVICTSWHSHPYTKGSYTSIGLKGCQRDIELLSNPIYSDPYNSKPALLFGGEATHPTFYSTVHGAYLSGRKCAEILLEPDSDQAHKQASGANCSSERDISSWIRGIDLN